ncbi:unnamed protein product, partial [Ceratitis capitata]
VSPYVSSTDGPRVVNIRVFCLQEAWGIVVPYRALIGVIAKLRKTPHQRMAEISSIKGNSI